MTDYPAAIRRLEHQLDAANARIADLEDADRILRARLVAAAEWYEDTAGADDASADRMESKGFRAEASLYLASAGTARNTAASIRRLLEVRTK